MRILNAIWPIKVKMVSAFVFAAQVVLLAAIMVLFATWLQALLVPQMMDTAVECPTPSSFHYAKCNVTFVHTPFSHYFPSPGLMVPEGNLEWEKHSCLLSSYLGIIFYHLSCLLLSLTLLQQRRLLRFVERKGELHRRRLRDHGKEQREHRRQRKALAHCTSMCAMQHGEHTGRQKRVHAQA